MLGIEEPTFLEMEDFRPEPLPDPVVHGVAKNGRDKQQGQDDLHGDELLGGECSHGEKKGITWQERRHHQSGFTKNDEKQQDVNQHPIVLDHPFEVILGVQKKLDELFQDLHGERLPNATKYILGRKFSALSRLQSRISAAKQF